MRRSHEVILRRTIQVGIILIVLSFLFGCGSGRVEAQIDKNVSVEGTVVDDRELITMLGSRDKYKSFEAARQIFERGDKMISLLVTNKGNRKPFAWGSLGNPQSGSITFAPGDDPAWDEGRIVTVEVASIYLICAIYKQDFEFGQSAYLRSKEEVAFNKYNTTARVSEAWSAIENWIKMMNSEGIATLRERKAEPLAKTKFFF
jgi:hypothetical protein